jgi:outer membrane lipoprotein-sorting protein
VIVVNNPRIKKSARWLPAVVAPVLVIAGVVAIPAVANADSTPPSKTAQQVLALIAGSKDAAYSGTVTQSSDLGLPQLPTTGPGSSSSGSDSTSQILDLLTASHTARVFADGSTKERLQVLDTLAERDVVRNGNDVWTYDSKTKAATHITLPSKGSDSTGATPSPSATALTPSQLAQKFVTAITPTTKLSVSRTDQVAGRSVYALTLTPDATSSSTPTLVSHVTLSVDAQTGLPLKVVVDARGQKSDAFSVGFSKIDFSTPAASTFEFTPPKGAKVTTPTAPTHKPGTHTPHGDRAKPTVSGTGWSSIVELPARPAGSSTKTPGADQSALLSELTTPVAGGKALQTSLLSVLLLDDGRVLIGSVPIASLEAAAQ